MDKKEAEKKGINLMPEDLRSKESGLLSKMKAKTDFGHDLVLPKESDIHKTDYTEKKSFIDSIKSWFNQGTAYGQHDKVKKDKPEEKKENKVEKKDTKTSEDGTVKIEMHVPSKDLMKDQLKVDYTDSVLGDVKEGKPSLVDQLKGLFSSHKKKTPKVPQPPKVERVPERPIMPKELDVAEDKSGQAEAIDILEDKNVKTIPELKVDSVSPVNIPEVPKSEEAPVVDKKPLKKGTDFYIPNLEKEVEEEKPEPPKEDKKDKSILQKFHTPEKRIKAKFLDDGGGVDLIPDAVKVRSWRQIAHLLVVTVFSFAFVIAVFYGFLYYQEQEVAKQKQMEEEQITSLEEEIVGYKELNNQISDLGMQIKNIHQLLSLHFYWTNFFQLLEKYTIDGVYYAGMTAGSGGAMTLDSKADSFETLAKQITILEQEEAKEFIQDVKVSAADYDEIKEQVNFSMTITLNPTLFLYNENYINDYSQDLE